MRILVVEEDSVQASQVSGVLRTLHYAVTVAGDIAQAIHCLRSERIDAAILAWQLSGQSGIEVLHWIRAQKNQCGVLFLAHHVHENDVVRALDAGADDFMIRPFRPEELALRMKSLLRRVPWVSAHSEAIKIGHYALDPLGRTVTLRGSMIDLTTKEFQLAASFFTNLGKTIPRESLAMTAWGRELGVQSRSLDTHIYRIRQKLKLCQENGLRLSSVYTHGYRLEHVKHLE